MRKEKVEGYEFIFKGDFKDTADRRVELIMNSIEAQLDAFTSKNDLLDANLSFKTTPEKLLIYLSPAFPSREAPSFTGNEGLQFLKLIVQELEHRKFDFNKENIDFKRYDLVSEELKINAKEIFSEPVAKTKKSMKP